MPKKCFHFTSSLNLMCRACRLTAMWFTATGLSTPRRLWSSRTRCRVSYLSPTLTSGGGPITSTDRLACSHSLSPKRRPNRSSLISRTSQTWPKPTSTHRTPIYRWVRSGRCRLYCLFCLLTEDTKAKSTSIEPFLYGKTGVAFCHLLRKSFALRLDSIRPGQLFKPIAIKKEEMLTVIKS